MFAWNAITGPHDKFRDLPPMRLTQSRPNNRRNLTSDLESRLMIPGARFRQEIILHRFERLRLLRHSGNNIPVSFASCWRSYGGTFPPNPSRKASVNSELERMLLPPLLSVMMMILGSILIQFVRRTDRRSGVERRKADEFLPFSTFRSWGAFLRWRRSRVSVRGGCVRGLGGRPLRSLANPQPQQPGQARLSHNSTSNSPLSIGALIELGAEDIWRPMTKVATTLIPRIKPRPETAGLDRAGAWRLCLWSPYLLAARIRSCGHDRD